MRRAASAIASSSAPTHSASFGWPLTVTTTLDVAVLPSPVASPKQGMRFRRIHLMLARPALTNLYKRLGICGRASTGNREDGSNVTETDCIHSGISCL